LAQNELFEIGLVSVEFWSVNATELHFSADCDTAYAAHAHAVNHDGCECHNGWDVVGLGYCAYVSHHYNWTHDDASVELFLLQEFLEEV